MGTESKNERRVSNEEENSTAIIIKFSGFLFWRMCLGKGRKKVGNIYGRCKRNEKDTS